LKRSEWRAGRAVALPARNDSQAKRSDSGGRDALQKQYFVIHNF
jgi:hypothetical protein